MSSFIVSVKGKSEIEKALSHWLDPELTKQLDAGAKKAALLYARALRVEVRPVSKLMARSVYVHRAKREKPAWVVGHHRKKAYFWHMVIGGTKDHGPKKAGLLTFIPNFNPYIGASGHGVGDGRVRRVKRVRGVAPNPLVERVGTRMEAQAFAQVDNQLDK